jgi:hypothetical protein
MTAARAGKADVIKLLYAAGANINTRENWHGQTALMWAAAENHPAAIATLKELGADFKARSDGGFTPLLFAVREGRIEAVETLLELGASVNDTIQPQKAPAKPAPPAGTAQAGANANATSASQITSNGAPVTQPVLREPARWSSPSRTLISNSRNICWIMGQIPMPPLKDGPRFTNSKRKAGPRDEEGRLDSVAYRRWGLLRKYR